VGDVEENLNNLNLTRKPFFVVQYFNMHYKSLNCGNEEKLSPCA